MSVTRNYSFLTSIHHSLQNTASFVSNITLLLKRALPLITNKSSSTIHFFCMNLTSIRKVVPICLSVRMFHLRNHTALIWFENSASNIVHSKKCKVEAYIMSKLIVCGPAVLYVSLRCQIVENEVGGTCIRVCAWKNEKYIKKIKFVNNLMCQTFDRTGGGGDRNVTHPLFTQEKRHTATTRMYIHAQTGTEPTIAKFQRFKSVYAGEIILLLLFNITKLFDLRCWYFFF